MRRLPLTLLTMLRWRTARRQRTEVAAATAYSATDDLTRRRTNRGRTGWAFPPRTLSGRFRPDCGGAIRTGALYRWRKTNPETRHRLAGRHQGHADRGVTGWQGPNSGII